MSYHGFGRGDHYDYEDAYSGFGLSFPLPAGFNRSPSPEDTVVQFSQVTTLREVRAYALGTINAIRKKTARSVCPGQIPKYQVVATAAETKIKQGLDLSPFQLQEVIPLKNEIERVDALCRDEAKGVPTLPTLVPGVPPPAPPVVPTLPPEPTPTKVIIEPIPEPPMKMAGLGGWAALLGIGALVLWGLTKKPKKKRRRRRRRR